MGTMPSRRTIHCLNLCLEERGKAGQIMLEVEILYEFDPGDRSFVYNQDQVYIGCPARATIVGVSAMRATGEDWDFTRKDRPDWFKWLDGVALDMVQEDEDLYSQHCLEQSLGV